MPVLRPGLLASISTLTVACVLTEPAVPPLDSESASAEDSGGTTISINLDRLVAGVHMSAQTTDGHGFQGASDAAKQNTAVDFHAPAANHADTYVASVMARNLKLPPASSLLDPSQPDPDAQAPDVLAPFAGTVWLLVTGTAAPSADVFKGEVKTAAQMTAIRNGTAAFPLNTFEYGSGSSWRGVNIITVVKAPGHYAKLVHTGNLPAFRSAAIDASLRNALATLETVTAPTGGHMVGVNTGITVNTGTPVARLSDWGFAQGDPHIHFELYRTTTSADLVAGTLYTEPPGTSVDFSSAADVTYLGNRIIDPALDAGGLASPSRYLYPAMPRNSYAVNVVAFIDTTWDGNLAGVQLAPAANGTPAGATLAHGTMVTVSSAPDPEAQRLWYQVTTASGTQGWIAAQYLRPQPFVGTDWQAALGWCTGSGAQLMTGDFNGDRRIDLLCHDSTSGDKWIAHANSSGHFTGTDWQAALGWCAGSDVQLKIGDFNGDERSDMLCHHTGNGHKWIALAGATGQFTGTSWESALGWCYGAGAQLEIGDFNGDRRSDMLCHHTANGHKWVTLASAAGQFTGPTWGAAMGWCYGAGAQLEIGDFNGDGRSDMLCHHTASGYKWISLASGSGQFAGTSWSANMNWCYGAGAQLEVADLDGDRRSDMLCHHTANGNKWASYATPGGQFTGTDWSATMSWCYGASGQLLLADVNGDARADLLCHELNNGYKWLAYSRAPL
jgi:hypothetical protein